MKLLYLIFYRKKKKKDRNENVESHSIFLFEKKQTTTTTTVLRVFFKDINSISSKLNLLFFVYFHEKEIEKRHNFVLFIYPTTSCFLFGENEKKIRKQFYKGNLL
jgi:hypothetical protein